MFFVFFVPSEINTDTLKVPLKVVTSLFLLKTPTCNIENKYEDLFIFHILNHYLPTSSNIIYSRLISLNAYLFTFNSIFSLSELLS